MLHFPSWRGFLRTYVGRGLTGAQRQSAVTGHLHTQYALAGSFLYRRRCSRWERKSLVDSHGGRRAWKEPLGQYRDRGYFFRLGPDWLSGHRNDRDPARLRCAAEIVA